jgi:FtsZ-binding cell division protein ZapB
LAEVDELKSDEAALKSEKQQIAQSESDVKKMHQLTDQHSWNSGAK